MTTSPRQYRKSISRILKVIVQVLHQSFNHSPAIPQVSWLLLPCFSVYVEFISYYMTYTDVTFPTFFSSSISDRRVLASKRLLHRSTVCCNVKDNCLVAWCLHNFCGNALQYKTLIIESIKITLTLERMVFGDVPRCEPCKEQPLLIIGQYVFIIAITDTISFKKQ